MNAKNKTLSSAKGKLMVSSLLAGFVKHLGNQASIKLGNATYTPADLTALLKSVVDAHDAATALKAQWQKAVATVGTAGVDAHPVVKLLAGYVRVTFGTDQTILTDFGLAPAKTATVKPKVLVEAAVKAKATRTARNTMSKKQKKAIKGQPSVATSSVKPA